MKLGRDLIVGLSSSIWAALIGFAAIPIYIKYLGIESYGLIGFYATLYAILQVLDMGMAATVNREVARCSATGDMTEAKKVLHNIAVINWVLAVVIVGIVFAVAPFIANTWIRSKGISVKSVEHVIALMGVVIACRWPMSLYQAALIGAHRVAVTSVINMAMVTMGVGGAIILLTRVSPTIEAFFLWQAFVGIFHAIVMRAAAWKELGKSNESRFNIAELKGVWRFAAGMGGVGLTSLAFTQLDKVILSKMLELHEFGYYMLAAIVVSGMQVFILPLYNIIYPQFSKLVAANDGVQVLCLYRLGTRALAAVLFPLTMTLVVSAEDFLQLWMGESIIARNVAPLIALLAIGSALNGVMYFPYSIQLAYGMSWMPLFINIALMLFLTPLLIYLTHKNGAVGGAQAWMLAEAVYVVCGAILTHRYVLKGIVSKWLLRDIGIPIVVTVAAGVLGSYVIKIQEYTIYERVFWVLAFASMASMTILLSMRELCNAVGRYFRRLMLRF